MTRRLAAAGMIVLGKTITVEFAKGIVGINHIQGTPHNPWSEEHCVPGGSSAGSAVAVASGMAPMGLGTRYRRLGPCAGGPVRYGRPQDYGRQGQPIRDIPAELDPRFRGTVDP